MTDERLIGELLRAVALPDAGPAMERTAAAARGAVAVRRPHTAFRLTRPSGFGLRCPSPQRQRSWAFR
jgi:hypothetical protein